MERLEIYERLAELDERGRGDAASAMLCRRTILEETGGPPAHAAPRGLAPSSAPAATTSSTPIALDIARALEGAESVAHAMLAARLRQRAGSWDETREAVEIAYRHAPARHLGAAADGGARARARASTRSRSSATAP